MAKHAKRFRMSVVGLVAAVAIASPACKKRGDAGIASVDDVPAVLAEATKLGESTWPGAKVAGVRVADMVPRGGRENVYGVHVSFEFDADATDPTAKSGAVMCTPKCTASRAKIKLVVPPPLATPCSLADALAAAKRAGMSSKRPLITSGTWNMDRGPGWRFQSDANGPAIKIGDGCAAI